MLSSAVKSVVEFQDYKDFLRHQIEANRSVRGYQSSLAKAAGCHPSFLSQAVNSHVQLTPDHGAGLCQLWRMTEIDTDYFLELIQLARASSPRLKTISQRKLAQLKKQRRELRERFRSARSINKEFQTSYFSAWHWSAIHALCGVPEFRTLSALRQRLGISEIMIRETLLKLQRMGLVKQHANGTWVSQESDLHLPRDSSMIVAHHHNWRLKALLNAQEQDMESVHYTAVYAISKQDFDRIRTEINALIESTRTQAAASEEEEAYALCLDWFRV